MLPKARSQRSPTRLAVLIPCCNEALSIGAVVAGFRANLPTAEIFVYDNNSQDATAAIARAAGARVRTERRQGKGHVVRRMFADVEADCYILVDGDDTYAAAAAVGAVDAVLDDGFDFVNIERVAAGADAYRRGHVWGNRILSGVVRVFFGRELRDMLSGYKALSRRFVKSFPAMTGGFEIETELALSNNSHSNT